MPDGTIPEPGVYRVIRRNGEPALYDQSKIEAAMRAAFLDTEGQDAATSQRIRQLIPILASQVTGAVFRTQPGGGTIHIEDIQDQVELVLMRAGEQKVARSYVLYREAHAAKRAAEQPKVDQDDGRPKYQVVGADGSKSPLIWADLDQLVMSACEGLECDPAPVIEGLTRNVYDGIKQTEIAEGLAMSIRQYTDRHPDYSFAAARSLLLSVAQDAYIELGLSSIPKFLADVQAGYSEYFKAYVGHGIKHELIDPMLGDFDLDALGAELEGKRDLQLDTLGMATLRDRYLLHVGGTRFELPQAMFMRVAMGLASNEADKNARAIEFYHLLSSFDFMSSTPTLFNSGTLRPQLSSCYLTTVPDDLSGIYGAIHDNAMLSKFAGGLGNDWTQVRSLGAHIKGTNGKSQGVVPFLKVVNDTAVAVNQGGRRKGAVCAYLETWHKDIQEFLDLRKNTGDERRRCHDMNTANWIPDLFMRRVLDEGDWTLFSPSDVPDLHDLTGQAFKSAYEAYEAKTKTGEITDFKTIPAVTLWRKMLGMVFETGHPWLTFKDPCNIRSPQQHVGVVHGSNLCTEITLNTAAGDEIAVCNLGSINLVRHLTTVDDDVVLDEAKVGRTIKTAMRMLDNVVDYNYYAVETAKQANQRHRAVGVGLMGFQDALYAMGLHYQTEEAVEFADASMELISWHSINASSDLAVEKGQYSTFEGSLWSQGILPIDSIDMLEKERGQEIEVDRKKRLDWDGLREKVKTQGMRNSNCMAIAPTATIANITGVSQSIEPTYQNLYVKSNLSGEFTVTNRYLYEDLKDAGEWDAVMAADIKHADGSVQSIDRVPQHLKDKYRVAFEIDPEWLIRGAAKRQKWIDQAQSLNLYMAEPSGTKLDRMYKKAWAAGLKTTYYLRTMGATHAEKSTVEDSRLNQVKGASSGSAHTPATAPAASGSTQSVAPPAPSPAGAMCSIEEIEAGSCESCS